MENETPCSAPRTPVRSGGSESRLRSVSGSQMEYETRCSAPPPSLAPDEVDSAGLSC